MTTLEILKAARELLSDRKRWTYGTEARDKHSHEVFTRSSRAVRWCAFGAISKVAGDADANNVIRKVANITGRHLVAVNDMSNHRFAYEQVIDVLDESIAKLS